MVTIFTRLPLHLYTGAGADTTDDRDRVRLSNVASQSSFVGTNVMYPCNGLYAYCHRRRFSFRL